VSGNLKRLLHFCENILKSLRVVNAYSQLSVFVVEYPQDGLLSIQWETKGRFWDVVQVALSESVVYLSAMARKCVLHRLETPDLLISFV
jgi:hypothetical protein